VLRAPVRSAGLAPRALARRIDAGLLTRRLGTHRFVATAVVDRSSLSGRERAGVAVTRGGPFALGGQAIGIAVGLGTVTVWARGGRRPVERTVPVALAGREVHLRLVLDGRRARLSVSADGVRWRRIGPVPRSPVAETARVALTVGGQRAASARFARATLVER
jgi:hypothetical protein